MFCLVFFGFFGFGFFVFFGFGFFWFFWFWFFLVFWFWFFLVCLFFFFRFFFGFVVFRMEQRMIHEAVCYQRSTCTR